MPGGQWDEGQFQQALDKKYAILQQGANTADKQAATQQHLADTTRQNTANQLELGRATEAGAMARANLASQTQQNISASEAANRMAIANQTESNRMALGTMAESGLNSRAQLGADTQKYISGEDNSTRRDIATQQNNLGKAQLGLEAAKAAAADDVARINLTRPTTGYDPTTNQRITIPGANLNDRSKTGTSYFDAYTRTVPTQFYRDGGPVEEGQTIVVGEENPETFVPADGSPIQEVGTTGPEVAQINKDGVILPMEAPADPEARAALRAAPVAEISYTKDGMRSFNLGKQVDDMREFAKEKEAYDKETEELKFDPVKFNESLVDMTDKERVEALEALSPKMRGAHRSYVSFTREYKDNVERAPHMTGKAPAWMKEAGAKLPNGIRFKNGKPEVAPPAENTKEARWAKLDREREESDRILRGQFRRALMRFGAVAADQYVDPNQPQP